MPKVAAGLTAAKVKSLISNGEPGRYAAGNNLYLSVTKPGQAVWTFRYTIAGRAREMGLGPADPEGREGVALRDAADAAVDAKRLVREGIDPLDHRKAARAAQKAVELAGKTFREAASQYIATHSPGWRNEKHRAQWTASLEAYAYPKIGSLALAAVTRQHVLEILTPIWATKRETARRVRQRLEMVFTFAAAQGWITTPNPVPGAKLAILLLGKVAKTVKHHAALDWKAIAPFVAQLRAQPGTAALALEFTVLTAARTTEVLQARWSEIALAEGVWAVPAERMKAEKPHRVPLSPAALAVLDRLAPLRPQDDDGRPDDGWVFPGQGWGKPLSNMAMLKVLERMKAGELTAHGFRSTFKDWARAKGWNDDLSERALAHTEVNKVRAAYARNDLLDERRPMMEAWAEHCGRGPAEVVPLRAVGG